MLVVDGLVIGQRVNGKWRQTPEKYEYAGKVRFRIVGIGKLEGATTGDGVGYDDIMHGSMAGVIRTDTPSYQMPKGPAGSVLISALKPSFPRKIATLSTKSRTYLSIAQGVMRSKGVTESPIIRQAFSVDLDGDGRKEVLLAGANATSPWDAKNMEKRYSWVILRYTKSGKGITKVLLFDAEPKGMFYLNRIRAIADLDGDGAMEVVTSSDYHEGQSGQLWTFKKGMPVHIMANGAGV